MIPLVSAVIVSARPLEVIELTVRAALADPGVIEVILVVDGPGASTLGLSLDAFDAAQARLRVLRLTSAYGAELARRVGAETALGEVVWLLDDDVVPLPGCGLGHAMAHQETGADIVLGVLRTELKCVHKYKRDLANWRIDCRRQGAGTRAG